MKRRVGVGTVKSEPGWWKPVTEKALKMASE